MCLVGHARTLDPDHNFYDWAAVELHRQRKARGLSLDAVGTVIDRDRSLVARLESGHTKMSEGHADRLDAAWNTGGLFWRIIQYAKTRHNTEWAETRNDLQARATHHKIWALSWIPFPWQTEAYARASFEGARHVDVEAAVKARLSRQEPFTRTPGPLMRVYLDQGVIDQPVGGPEVRAEQLTRLIELAGQHTIRVVPRSAGAHVGRDGSFSIMTVGGIDIAYTETLGPGRLIQDPTEVRSYGTWFDDIGDVALSPFESLRLIKAVLESFT